MLDDKYIPPSLTCQASTALSGFVSEILGLLHHRGEALAGRVSASGTQGVAEVADFLLLQLVNRAEPLMAHFAVTPGIHPERLYATLLELAGEIASFTGRDKRPGAFPALSPRRFAALLPGRDDRTAAVAVGRAGARARSRSRWRSGATASASRRSRDRSLLDQAAFILAVRADASADAIRRHFPSQIKIGPVEQIRNLVAAALPGITIRALPVAPRQLPYHPGVIYFEMDRTGRFWEELKASGGMAVHVAGEFPNPCSWSAGRSRLRKR